MSVPRSIFQALLTLGVFVLASCQTTGAGVKLPDGSIIGTYLYKPSGKGPYPAVIVLHHAGGLTDQIKEFSGELSGENFVTVAVDYTTGSGWLSDKVGAVYDYLQKLPEVDPGRIGMVGFSRGARLGKQIAVDWRNEYPLRPLRACVSYYVGRGVEMPSTDLPPILFLHGDKDVETDAKTVVAFCEELKRMGNVCEAKIYKATYHAFTHNSSYGDYDHQATVDAYKRTVAFLNKHLRDAPIQ